MTKTFTIALLALALLANGCARHPMNTPLAQMFVVTVFAFGLGFDCHNQSAAEIRHHHNPNPIKRK